MADPKFNLVTKRFYWDYLYGLDESLLKERMNKGRNIAKICTAMEIWDLELTVWLKRTSTDWRVSSRQLSCCLFQAVWLCLFWIAMLISVSSATLCLYVTLKREVPCTSYQLPVLPET